MEENAMLSVSRKAWCLAGAVAVALICFFSGVHFDDGHADVAAFLAQAADNCHPERDEQLKYLLSLILPPLGLWTGMRFWKKGQASNASALGVQVLFLLTALACLIYQVACVVAFTNTVIMIESILLSFGTLYLLFRRDRQPEYLRPQLGSRLCWVLAIAYVLIMLSPFVYTSGNLFEAPEHVTFHLPFTWGEFVAVAAGKTPLVDFFSQYQNLTPLLLAPWIRLSGYSVTLFCLIMALFSALSLFSLHSVFRRAGATPLTALVLFISLAGASFRPFFETGDVRVGIFSYLAVSPLRLAAPCFIAWLLARCLEKPSRARAVILGLCAASFALNNLDFGIPAFVGAGAALVFFNTFRLKGSPSYRKGAQTSLGFAGAFLLSAVFWIGVLRVRSGAWPDLTAIVSFQRAMALAGFAMMPLPHWGVHLISYALLMAAVWIPLLRAQAKLKIEKLDALLLFSGISGLGSAAYYIGRSHPDVFMATVPGTMLAAGLLWLKLMVAWREPAAKTLRPLLVLPVWGIAFVLATGGMLAAGLPSVGGQWRRLTRQDDRLERWINQRADLVREVSESGRKKIAVIYHHGQWIAARAGVVNSYPFEEGGSMILQEQLRQALRAMEGVSVVFGDVPVELEALLDQQGFRVMIAKSLPAGSGGLGSFERQFRVWVR